VEAAERRISFSFVNWWWWLVVERSGLAGLEALFGNDEKPDRRDGPLISILVTQCLRNDIMKILAPGERMPCQRHVGPKMALKLLGSDQEEAQYHEFRMKQDSRTGVYMSDNSVVEEREGMGPIPDLITRFRKYQPPDDEASRCILHIRDWHSLGSSSREHIAQFGMHCVKNTEAARLVSEIRPPEGQDKFEDEKEMFINSTQSLDDLDGTRGD